MPRSRTRAALLGGAAASVAGAASVVGTWRRSRPRRAGRVTVPGLTAEAEVRRDAHGVPHVQAATETDAAAAQGFLQAQDRLWQMEAIRRGVRGRLAELAGPGALVLDRYVRTLGLAAVAEREAAALTGADRALVDAYCGGVNAYLASPAFRLPIELRLLLRRSVEPWTAADALLAPRLLALTLGANFESEIVRAQLVATLGAERLAELEPGVPRSDGDGPPVPLPRGAADAVGRALRGREELGAEGVGSNNWAVGPDRSATGAPLLANDPHLLLGLPPIWHVIDLAWPEGRVFGFSLPGTPGVVIGQTAHVAWGFTNVTADTQDLFVIDRERDVIRTRREEIRVRGRRRPEVLLVAETRHGPVVTEPRADEPRGLALRWTGLEPSATIGALRGVVHARTVDEVVEAMRGYGGATLNMLCADRDGGTAFKVVGGPVPVRGRGQGLVPVDAAAPDADWRGTVPYDELPGGRGTDGGVLVTANEQIVPDAYPHLISHEWLNAYRAERIREVLEGLDRISVEDCVRLQPDVRSLPGLRLQALLADVRAEDGPEARALELLRAWDGELAADSTGGAVAGVLLRQLVLETYAEVRNELERFLGSSGFSLLTAAVPFFGRTTPALLDALERRDDTFFRDGRTWDDVVAVALTRTVRELELASGPDPRRWTWGAVHPLVLDHPLAVLPGVGRMLRRGPFPLGGDADTVAQAWYPLANPREGRSVTAASMRFVADLADPDRSRFILAGGQSGHPADAAYDDHLTDWLAGRTRAVAWSEAAVERATVARLTLAPGG